MNIYINKNQIHSSFAISGRRIEEYILTFWQITNVAKSPKRIV
jgi:hypothetical protein